MIQTKDILVESLLEALETMAFMTTVEPEEQPVPPAETILGEIYFSGPVKGCVTILAGRDFCAMLAENIAALDDASDSACLDSMQELSNVTCGLVLPRIAQAGGELFSMSVPVVNDGDASPDWRQFVDVPGTCLLNIEEFVIAARLTVEE